MFKLSWPVRVKPGVKYKFARFQTLYSQHWCWLLSWHPFVLESLPRGWQTCGERRWEAMSQSCWHFMFSLKSHRNSEFNLLLIFFQLHGQSQCPWLNVTTSHFEQGRGLGDPKPWSQPPLPLKDPNWIKILNYMELALAHVDTMQGDLISLLLV